MHCLYYRHETYPGVIFTVKCDWYTDCTECLRIRFQVLKDLFSFLDRSCLYWKYWCLERHTHKCRHRTQHYIHTSCYIILVYSQTVIIPICWTSYGQVISYSLYRSPCPLTIDQELYHTSWLWKDIFKPRCPPEKSRRDHIFFLIVTQKSVWFNLIVHTT